MSKLGLSDSGKEGFIYQTCQRRKVKSLCWHEGGSKPRVSSLLFTTYFSMGSLSHSGGSALVLAVVAITPHAFYLLLRDLFCSQTSSISQWPQGNNIRSNCCKVYPMNSIKCSSWYSSLVCFLPSYQSDLSRVSLFSSFSAGGSI